MSRNAAKMRSIDALVAALMRRFGAAAELVLAPLRTKRNPLLRPVRVDAVRHRRKRIRADYWR